MHASPVFALNMYVLEPAQNPQRLLRHSTARYHRCAGNPSSSSVTSRWTSLCAGETNLKVRRPLDAKEFAPTEAEHVGSMRVTVAAEPPNPNLHSFVGKAVLEVRRTDQLKSSKKAMGDPM